ncbi:MAG: hypothetical protein H8E26_12390 [FCB group bacterium]|nr:hypothetical protein [FCB group bacterium]MBL7028293.1 hypothetical protein [Candidatus Neomarinimicrobiota bacterium]MBL7121612.1 hypothetical protein [Candidatus Neomarinimicrobiota bacterium]
MYKLLTLLPLLFIIACSDPDSRGLDLNPGEAVLTIDNITHGAQANLGTRMLGDTEYEQITLQVSDTIHVDILNENFQEGMVSWTGDSFDVEGTMIFMTHYGYGGGYGPRSGFLIISEQTELSISGIFQLELQNFASSCYNCPEDRLNVEGKFIAQWE